MKIEGHTFALIGGAGFIGSHVADQLAREGAAEIRVLDNFIRGDRRNLRDALVRGRVAITEGSMTDQTVVRDVVRGADGVFVLSSLWLGESTARPREAWEVNVTGTWNVIEACLEAKVPRVVYSSSASVYGDAVFTPMTEDHPFANRTTYGATKVACEQMLRAAHQEQGLDYVALRYMNAYGPRMDERGTYVSVIVKALGNIERGVPPVIHGDGEQMYDFLFVEDAAEANLLAMRADTVSDEAFNVATGVGTTINGLVEKILRATASDLRPEHRPDLRAPVTRRIGSVAKAQSLLGFTAKTTLDAGIARFISWRRENGAPTAS